MNPNQDPATKSSNQVFDLALKGLFYGKFKAVRDVELSIEKGTITAFIGPSGCGKSTVLRCLNRMNDLKRGFRLEGEVRYRGKEIYGKSIDPVAVRRTIGMVFQNPNPFGMTVYRNVAYGLKLNGYKGNRDEKVEQALRGAALWDEVKDKLHESALDLSGGQQQRLCIARSIATEPDVLLMDEPCSAIDPLATRKIEELMQELKKKYTIAIVTHNLQQAKRLADKTAFLYVNPGDDGDRTGYLVEYGDIFRANLAEPHRRAAESCTESRTDALIPAYPGANGHEGPPHRVEHRSCQSE
ncbi:MAG: phosphate ABC transporter ATP-binding protein [Pseudomonadota bacterium]